MNKATRLHFSNFLDRIEAQLPIDGKISKYADLATFIGVRQGQIREWVTTRRYIPNGAITLQMLEWVKLKEVAGAFVSSAIKDTLNKAARRKPNTNSAKPQ